MFLQNRFYAAMTLLVVAFALVSPTANVHAERTQPVTPTPVIADHDGDHHHDDAFVAPRPTGASVNAASNTAANVADVYQPSAFLAGNVAVQVLFVQSNGSNEPSTERWTSTQVTAIEQHISTALNWWRAQLPNAKLSFNINTRVVNSGYEPITHGIDTEGQWVGDVMKRLGYTNSSHFEQVYAANDALRKATGSDWATTIFVVNSEADADGRFADQYFDYAYVGGPFMVVTSDNGPFGTDTLPAYVAHEMGHIFGALDQYAAAGSPCTQQSGYLNVANTNSQVNNCGTGVTSIMLNPFSAFTEGAIDQSARGQLGYRDSNNNNIPDPLDTTPVAQLTVSQPAKNGRPVVRGTLADTPFASSTQRPVTINHIERAEYRVDGGAWRLIPPADGAYNSATETVSATLPLYDGNHAVEVRAVNSVGAQTAVSRQTVNVSGLGAEPAYSSDANAAVNTAQVDIALGAPKGSMVQISNDPLFTNAPWLPVNSSIAQQLGAQDGSYIVYVRFRDSKGIEGPLFEHNVLLDRTPPTATAVLYEGSMPQLDVDAKDEGSGVADVKVLAQGANGIDWSTFQQTLALAPQTNAVQVLLRDAAGNVSAPIEPQRNYRAFFPLVAR